MTNKPDGMVERELPSPELLRDLLMYEPDTGKLFWRERTPDMFDDGGNGKVANCSRWNKMYAGKPALEHKKAGYLEGCIFNHIYKAHRVIWAMQHGWPKTQIDHINHDRSDNRIENLRLATALDNARNHSRNKKNTSGHSGVDWDHERKGWNARIGVGYKRVFLGRFKNLGEAMLARKLGEFAYGFHPNHGMEKQ